MLNFQDLLKQSMLKDEHDFVHKASVKELISYSHVRFCWLDDDGKQHPCSTSALGRGPVARIMPNPSLVPFATPESRDLYYRWRFAREHHNDHNQSPASRSLSYVDPRLVSDEIDDDSYEYDSDSS